MGTLVVALYKSYGFVPDPVMIWTTGNNRLLGGFLAALFASMVLVGFLLERARPARLRQIVAATGQAPTDFTTPDERMKLAHSMAPSTSDTRRPSM